jgi:hypothetical protein
MSEYERWLDERLGKKVLWTTTAWNKLLTRELTEESVKECITSGEKRESMETESGPKLVVERTLHDPIYEALVVVFIDHEDYYLVISNHLRKRKQKKR